MTNIRDRYEHVYIFLSRKQKQNHLANAHPSVCPQKLCTLKLVGRVYTGNRFNPIARRLTKLKPDEIVTTFLYLGIRLIEYIRSDFISKVRTRI